MTQEEKDMERSSLNFQLVYGTEADICTKENIRSTLDLHH